jgi:DNA-binding NarL/FixJ family response regulator
MRAAEDGDEKRVRELVTADAKLDLVDRARWSTLHFASYYGHARVAKLLLDGKYEGKGAAINLQTSSGDTALILASFYGREAVVRLLLERGADVTLLASGLTDREIAERLVVSEETAKTYTKRLLKTLDVNNRLQAVLKGMRCGMVQV